MSIQIDPVLRLTFKGRDLGIFTEAELLKLRDQIDRLFGLQNLIAKDGVEIATFMEAYCTVSGITLFALRGKTKTEPLLLYRQIAMCLACELGIGQATVARAFKRDDSVVTWTRTALENRRATNHKEASEFKRLRAAVLEHLNQHQPEQKIVNL